MEEDIFMSIQKNWQTRWIRISNKIRKLGNFSEVSQLGTPTPYHPVNLIFVVSEAYVIGYTFFVSYNGTWRLEYTLDPTQRVRVCMNKISGIKTERELLEKVSWLLETIRKQCGVSQRTE